MPDSYPRLVYRDRAGIEREAEITHTPFGLGREKDNDLVFPGDQRISRHHARILQDARGYVIEDTSRHGTLVNDERITSCPLRSGDQIILGFADACQMSFVTEQTVLPELLAEIGKVKESPVPQLQHLRLLLQMAQTLTRAAALEEVLTVLVDAAVQLADADRGLLFLREDGGELRLRLALGRGGVHLAPTLTDYSREVLERVAKTGREEITLHEELTDRTLYETGIIQGAVRGIVALPLQKLPVTEMSGDTLQQTAAELLGVLYLDSSARPTALTGLDRQVLQTLALEGATIIENARLFRAAREQERMRHQLSLARNIQQGLLPHDMPKSDYFELRALSVPCQTVGGDYFDVVRLPRDRFGFAVADVSGKGLPAALLAATLQGAFVAVARGDPDPGDLFHRVNDFLCERTPPEMFATVFYGVLDQYGEFTFVNAGHSAPLVVRQDGAVTSLDFSNVPLGLFSGARFEAGQVQLQSGEHVLIFSDGVTEAQNAEEEMFGETRLKALLEECSGQSAEAICDKVMTAVRDFVGAAPQADDVTLTVLRFGPPPQ